MTSYGPVTGFIESVPDPSTPHYQARAFYGIPYAAPPIGNLRWADPVPPQNWTSPLEANQFAPGCPQICALPSYACPTSISEDCLYLNIWTPTTMTAPLPVMFWIHGGHFEQGSGAGPLYDAAVLVNTTEVVVVTINYRLASLGWLYFQEAPGNMGLKDQILALNWVQKNIAAFGGDPTRVTIFGQSAGGTSVAVLLVSPPILAANPPLYHAAIIQSNPFGLPMVTPTFGQGLLLRLQALVGCSASTPNITCMRGVPMLPLLVAQTQAAKHVDLTDFLDIFYAWAPALGDLLPDEPLNLFANGKSANVPMIMGTVEEEGRLFIYEGFTSSVSKLEYEAAVAVLFGLGNFGKLSQLYPSVDGDNRNVMSALITDYLFACPTRYAVRAQSKRSPTYLYRFNHSFDYPGIWQNLTMCEGHVCHAIEIPFVFNLAPFNIVPFSANEVDLAARMSAAWGAFAQADYNPHVANWNPYDVSTDLAYDWLSGPGSGPIADLRQRYCDAWDSIGYHY